MKIKLTLRGRAREDIDLLVTTDATATVGDVAAVLAAAGPEGAGPAVDPESVTLRILDPLGGRVVSVLPPSAFVTETVLHSGSLIDIASTDGAVSMGEVAGELRILAGPDAGMRVPLSFGGTIIGRSAACAITLADPRVSKNMRASPSVPVSKSATSIQRTVLSSVISASRRQQLNRMMS